MSVIIDPNREQADKIAAVREFARLQRAEPSPAAPLTDEDLAIFERQSARCGNQFMWYAKAAYLEYYVFYGSAMGKRIEECRDKL